MLTAHSEYRPDIDGLRAFAVIAVVMFHANPNILHGGFVGVDVFFVISGFLISGIIFRDLERGRFSFSDFYARRIRRIFPALLLVLIFCLAFGWAVLTPDEFKQLGRHTIGAATFVSNLVLWREAGYFDAAAQSKPLLHLWSLGIEEQFYLVWPLSLVLLWKKRTRMLAAISILTVASFGVNLVLVNVLPSATFYLPITRIWELLVGAAFACFTLQYRMETPRPAGTCLAALGCLMIALSCIFFRESQTFPGWRALVPVLGTVFLISAGAQSWINKRVLASPVLVFIGLMSYPLYLWHWPLLVYLRLIAESHVSLSQAPSVEIGVVGVSVLLAWLTWRFVETSIRRSGIPLSLKAGGLVAAMAVAGVAGGFSATKMVHTRLETQSDARILSALGDIGYAHEENIIKVATTDSGIDHFKIASRSNRVTLFAGDSHVYEYWPRVVAEIKANPDLASGVFVIHGGCPPLPGLDRDRPGYRCAKYFDYWTAQARATNVANVVLGGYWEFYIFGETAEGVRTGMLGVSGKKAEASDFEGAWKGLEATIVSLVHSGKRVYILSSTPASRTFDPRGMIYRLRGFKLLTGIHSDHMAEILRLQPIKKADFNAYVAPIDEKLNTVAANTGATIIRPTDYFCDSRLCPATDRDGSPLYRDADHLRSASIVEKAAFINTVLQP